MRSTLWLRTPRMTKENGLKSCRAMIAMTSKLLVLGVAVVSNVVVMVIVNVARRSPIAAKSNAPSISGDTFSSGKRNFASPFVKHRKQSTNLSSNPSIKSL